MTNPFSKALCASMLVAMTVLGAGCASTMSSEESAMMADILTERRISAALNAESSLDASTILVSCFDGVVTLAGNVNNALDRALAEQIVLGIDGVQSVNNLISSQG